VSDHPDQADTTSAIGEPAPDQPQDSRPIRRSAPHAASHCRLEPDARRRSCLDVAIVVVSTDQHAATFGARLPDRRAKSERPRSSTPRSEVSADRRSGRLNRGYQARCRPAHTCGSAFVRRVGIGEPPCLVTGRVTRSLFGGDQQPGAFRAAGSMRSRSASLQRCRRAFRNARSMSFG
jgi:hypothetical protein